MTENKPLPTTSTVPPVSPTTANLASSGTSVTATKAPVGTSSATATTTASGMKPKQPRKIFGVDMRSFLTVVGLVLFFVIAMLAVLIALRQRQAPEEVSAPTGPQSQPQAAETGSCSLTFTVAGTTPTPSPSGSPSPTPSVTPSPSPSTTPSPTPSVTPSPSPSSSPSPSPTYACNSPCTTNANCESVNADYICASTSGGNFCRLETNVTSASCTPTVNTYACNSTCSSNADCQSANSNYICVNVDGGNYCRLQTNTTAANCQPPTSPVPSPTPTIGCNEACVTNADCANANHICSNSLCRLATNPESPYCAPPASPIASTPGVTPQPELPEQLPETGAEDLVRWLVPGIGALLLGALALFLL